MEPDLDHTDAMNTQLQYCVNEGTAFWILIHWDAVQVQRGGI